MKVYTIGHSTHPIDEFIDLLKVRGVEAFDVIDKKDSTAHTLTSFADVKESRITYPAEKK